MPAVLEGVQRGDWPQCCAEGLAGARRRGDVDALWLVPHGREILVPALRAPTHWGYLGRHRQPWRLWDSGHEASVSELLG